MTGSDFNYDRRNISIGHSCNRFFRPVNNVMVVTVKFRGDLVYSLLAETSINGNPDRHYRLW